MYTAIAEDEDLGSYGEGEWLGCVCSLGAVVDA